MSERDTDNQSLEPARQLTPARVGAILVDGTAVGVCLTVALLAAMLVGKLLVAQLGQMVFENGILIVVVFGVIATLATRLLDWSGYSYQLGFVDLNQRIRLPGHRAWTIGRWLLLPLILLCGLFALPKVLAPSVQTAVQQYQQQDNAVTAPTQLKVVVAKRAIPAQTVLTFANVALCPVARSVLQPNFEWDLNDVVGKAAIVSVANGQQITANILVNALPDSTMLQQSYPQSGAPVGIQPQAPLAQPQRGLMVGDNSRAVC